MSQIIITLSASDQTRVINAIASLKGYQAIIPDAPGVPGGANPESKAQFANRMLKEDLKSYVKQYEKTTSMASAGTTFDNQFTPADIT